MPPELGRLRESTGAAAGNVREVDVNLAIARELIGLLASAGMRADLLPATIPPGYLADAFVAIHADGAARPTARGWKIATPWRASEASNLLADAVTAAYAALVGLPEDRYGITYGMKGYYAFSANRVRYAVSPFTPCIIVETGFVTVASDREVIVDHPLRVARAIAAGIVRYLSSRPIPRTAEGRAAYLPPSYPPAVVAAGDAVLRARPGEDEPQVLRLELGTTVMPMQLRGDWTEVVVRGDFRSFGWVLASELRPAG
jgi:N-acetylmuramoyl-L-alanine amidase